MKTLRFLGIAITIIISSNSFGQKYGKTPEDSIKCITNLSLYGEFFKQKNYKDAYEPWVWVFKNCPTASENTYIRGAVIVRNRIDNIKDQKNKEPYIDTLMLVYDERIQFFGQKGIVLGRKGIDLAALSPSEGIKAYNILKEAIEIEGNKTKSNVILAYFLTTVKLAKEEKFKKDSVLEAYDFISDIVDYNIQNNKKDSSEFEKARNNIEFAFEPYASCLDLINIYTLKFQSRPEDINLLKKITRTLEKKKCTEDKLFYDASVKLFQLEPTPESAYNIGIYSIKREEYSKAADYFIKCAESTTDLTKKFESYYYLAKISLITKQFSKGKQYCLEAIKTKPTDGRSYIALGELYAAGAKDCGENELTSKVAFWVSVDKFNQAKNIDSSLSEEANKKISLYSKYFPSDNVIFFYNLQKGQSYTVGCWINETTTIR